MSHGLAAGLLLSLLALGPGAGVQTGYYVVGYEDGIGDSTVAQKRIREFANDPSPAVTDAYLVEKVGDTTFHHTRGQIHRLAAGEVLDTENGVNLVLRAEGVTQITFISGTKIAELQALGRLKFGPGGTPEVNHVDNQDPPTTSRAPGSIALGNSGRVWVNEDGTNTGWRRVITEEESGQVFTAVWDSVIHGEDVVFHAFRISAIYDDPQVFIEDATIIAGSGASSANFAVKLDVHDSSGALLGSATAAEALGTGVDGELFERRTTLIDTWQNNLDTLHSAHPPAALQMYSLQVTNDALGQVEKASLSIRVRA